MSKTPVWLDRFPVLAMHSPLIAERASCGGWFVYVDVTVKVKGGAMRVEAHGIVEGTDAPEIDKSQQGGLEVKHLVALESKWHPVSGVHIPCPSAVEALELANDIVFNITASNEVVNG